MFIDVASRQVNWELNKGSLCRGPFVDFLATNVQHQQQQQPVEQPPLHKRGTHTPPTFTCWRTHWH